LAAAQMRVGCEQGRTGWRTRARGYDVDGSGK
jgi:hypothetical protein